MPLTTNEAARPVTRDTFMMLARADRVCQTARILGTSVEVGGELLRVEAIRGLALWEGMDQWR